MRAKYRKFIAFLKFIEQLVLENDKTEDFYNQQMVFIWDNSIINTSDERIYSMNKNHNFNNLSLLSFLINIAGKVILAITEKISVDFKEGR
jgi:hypothetical protein